MLISCNCLILYLVCENVHQSYVLKILCTNYMQLYNFVFLNLHQAYVLNI